MLNTNKKAAERLYNATVRAGANREEYEPVNFSMKTDLNHLKFGAHFDHLLIEIGNVGRVALPLEGFKSPENRQSTRKHLRNILSDLRQMEEFPIVVDGKINVDALQSLKKDSQYILTDGNSTHTIYFNCLSSGPNEGISKLWFRIKQGEICTDHYLDLGKAQPGGNISLFSLPRRPALR